MQNDNLTGKAQMPIREKVVPKKRRVCQDLELYGECDSQRQKYHLHNTAHEAGVAKVDQSPESNRGVLGKAKAPWVSSQKGDLLVRRSPWDKLGAQPKLLVGLALVLNANTVELAIMNIILAGCAVDVALVQFNPELVSGRLHVLAHVGTPTCKVDALETGVESGCTSKRTSFQSIVRVEGGTDL